jgi:hypothetical protein
MRQNKGAAGNIDATLSYGKFQKYTMFPEKVDAPLGICYSQGQRTTYVKPMLTLTMVHQGNRKEGAIFIVKRHLAISFVVYLNFLLKCCITKGKMFILIVFIPILLLPHCIPGTRHTETEPTAFITLSHKLYSIGCPLPFIIEK